MNYRSGVGLVEIVLAVAIFGVIASAVASLAVTGLDASVVTTPLVEAQAYAAEALTAVRTIGDRAFNELNVNATGLTLTGNSWSLMGESTSETIGEFTRRVLLEDICRDGSGNIATCPSAYIDPHTKRVTAEVSWGAGAAARTALVTTMLTNWASQYWTQTGWNVGSGEAIWSNPGKYESDDGNINTQTPGEITLAQSSGGAHDETYTNAGDYTFDGNKIEVTGGVAALKGVLGSGYSGIQNGGIDAFEYDGVQGSDPDILHVSGDIYLIAYRGPGGDGFVTTVAISAMGDISSPTDALETVIDTFEYDTGNGGTPDLIHISGDTYAVAYAGAGSDGFVRTFTVTNAGDIGNSTIDSLEYDTANGTNPDIVQVGTGYYAVAYTGPGNDGWAKSFTIDTVGNIGNSVIDSLEWDASNGVAPKIISLGGIYYAVAYTGPGSDGWLATFSITTTGSISNSVINTYEFDGLDGLDADVVHVSGTVYAIAYRGTNNDGFLRTVNISPTGIIGGNIDLLEYDTSYAAYPDIKYVSGDYFLIANQYTANGPVGLVLLTIATNGDLPSSVIDEFTFDTNVSAYPKVISVGGDYWAIVYDGPGSDGRIITTKLEKAMVYPADNPLITPVSGVSMTGVSQITAFTETATKNGGEIFYQLSTDDGATWQYWNGSAWTPVTGAGQYNIANTVNNIVQNLSVTGGTLRVRAFLSSNGSQLVQLDNVQVTWAGGLFQSTGWLLSSAFPMTDASPVEIVEWDEDISACPGTCNVQIQVRTAPDSGGTPGVWSAWYGASGAGTYFTEPTGTRVPVALNGNQWVQYRVELSGDGTGTPTLQEVRINYQ